METLSIEDLRPNPRNPRKMSRDDFKSLVNAMKRWGDLSGVVRNLTTDHLVGGHQRTEHFKRAGAQPVIEERYDQPNSVGTVARGYILLGDEKYTYREVRWDEPNEKAANIAANRISGDFDNDMLAEWDYELSQLENGADLLEASGQSEAEINRLLKSVGVGGEDDDLPDDKPEEFKVALTVDQRAIVERALAHIKGTREIPAERPDAVNGGALVLLCQDYLNQYEYKQDDTTAPPAAPDYQPDQPVPVPHFPETPAVPPAMA